MIEKQLIMAILNEEIKILTTLNISLALQYYAWNEQDLVWMRSISGKTNE